jgi:DNA-binding NarL/FixJ family response regulator
MSHIRILIVEDEPLIAMSTSAMLEGIDYEVSAIAYDSDGALEQLRSDPPDLALLDVNLKSKLDGIQIAEIIRDQHDLPFIFLTSYASESIVERAKLTRPMGYIVKPFDERDLFTAIEIALYNYAQFVHPLKLDMERLNKKLTSPLTPREFEIIKDIYEGKTNQQLAKRHFISINTVKTHVKHLFEKLDVASRAEALVMLRNINQA